MTFSPQRWMLLALSFSTAILIAASASRPLARHDGQQCPINCNLTCEFDPEQGEIRCRCECEARETPPPKRTPPATPPAGTPTSEGTPLPSPTPTLCSGAHVELLCSVAGCGVGLDRVLVVMVNNCTGEIVDIIGTYCAACKPKPTPTVIPLPPPPPPCASLAISPDGISCVTRHRVGVASQAPIPEVERSPFPRGLVRVPMTFSVRAPALSAESWSERLPRGIPSESIRGWQMGLRWRWLPSGAGSLRITPPPPPTAWIWDERSWNVAAGLPAIGYGETSNHIFVTSSWGKPRNGPGELPSYQVMNLTYWEAQWAVRYEERQCVEWGEIVNKEGEIETVCARWDWIAQFDGWYPIDLRRFGNPNWYFTRRVLEPAPVIEVQGVIGRPE